MKRKKLPRPVVTVRMRQVDLEGIIRARVNRELAPMRATVERAQAQANKLRAIVTWLMHPHTCRAETRGGEVVRTGAENCDRCIAEADTIRVLVETPPAKRRKP